MILIIKGRGKWSRDTVFTLLPSGAISVSFGTSRREGKLACTNGWFNGAPSLIFSGDKKEFETTCNKWYREYQANLRRV